MSTRLTITLLVENTVKRRALLAEHGLAVWVESGDARVLWDTGQGYALGPNAGTLGIDLRAADAIALSHGHYDHTAGLHTIAPRKPPYTLYAHPAAFVPKYNDKNGVCSRTSDPLTESGPEALPAHFAYRSSAGRTEVAPDLWLTGEVPRTHAIEDTGGRFCLDKALTQPDPIVDDQSLVALTSRGWVILLGCAHAGVINTLELVCRWNPDTPVHALIGGMHLLNASPERMAWTLEQLRRFDLSLMAPLHCTGDAATRAIHAAFPTVTRDLHVGDTLTFS